MSDEKATEAAPAAERAAVDPAHLEAAVDKLLAQHYRDLHAERARREAARFDGGPCQWCGFKGPIRLSVRGAGDAAGWYGNGRECHWCHEDRRMWPSPDTFAARVIRQLLPPDAHRLWSDGHLVPRTGFRWFRDTPGAKPAAERWAYLDRRLMAAGLLVPAPEPQRFEKGEPCGMCGCDALWTWGGGDRYWQGEKSVIRPAGVVCAGCDKYHHVEEAITAFIGVEWMASRWEERRVGSQAFSNERRVADLFELRRWDQTPGAKPAPVPFAHWGDHEELRRRIFREFPHSGYCPNKRLHERLARECGVSAA